ncbi:hypothetical protein Taro_000127 [Colocasia esculenta]|uniref:Uncharacterized protein n=1 Tax=Colocasia esculenta TaxID=4460 RepID=A0A843TFR6_COLES|nr:hypothetical protein [Colocasia esculenta]
MNTYQVVMNSKEIVMVTYEVVTISKSLRVLKKSLRTRRSSPVNVSGNCQDGDECRTFKLIFNLGGEDTGQLRVFRNECNGGR